MPAKGEDRVYAILDGLGIRYEVFEHQAAPTIEIAQTYWKDIDSTHCKNLFFRNHKGNRHYLVILEQHTDFEVRSLESHLTQGKLSFASGWRLEKYLGVGAGSVTPFGLVNDPERHVKVFLDPRLRQARLISFHPNRNTASLVLDFSDFLRFLDQSGNEYEWLDCL